MGKFLFISYAAPPFLNPESILVGKLMKQLSKESKSFDLVMADPDHSIDGTDQVYGEIIHKELDESIKIHRIKAFESRFLSRLILFLLPAFINLPDSKWSWYFPAKRYASKLMQRYEYDFIYSRSCYLISHFVALFLKKRFGTPWIAHFSDPWTDNPYHRHNFITRWFNRRWERTVVEHADAIIFVNEAIQQKMMSKYDPSWAQKTHVIPHYFDPDLYPSSKPSSTKTVFTYTGNFYGNRSPLPLLQALRQLKEVHPEIAKNLVVQIVGLMRKRDERLIKKWGLSSLIHAHRPVSYLKSLDMMMRSHALIVIDAPMKENLFLPSKLIDYIGANKPILGITPLQGPSAELIRSLDGTVVDPSDLSGICDAFLDYHQNIHASGSMLHDELRQAFSLTSTTAALRHVFDKVQRTRNRSSHETS